MPTGCSSAGGQRLRGEPSDYAASVEQIFG